MEVREIEIGSQYVCERRTLAACPWATLDIELPPKRRDREFEHFTRAGINDESGRNSLEIRHDGMSEWWLGHLETIGLIYRLTNWLCMWRYWENFVIPLSSLC